MLQILLDYYEAARSVPSQFALPVLVFALVVTFALSFLMLGSKRRLQIEKDPPYSLQTRAIYQIPGTYSVMQPSEKRRVTIQNLYLNHRWDLEGIARLLDVDRAIVQDVLAKSGHLRRS